MTFRTGPSRMKFSTVRRRIKSAQPYFSDSVRATMRSVITQGYQTGSWVGSRINSKPGVSGVIKGNYEGSVEIATRLENFGPKLRALTYAVALVSYNSGYALGGKELSKDVKGLLSLLD